MHGVFNKLTPCNISNLLGYLKRDAYNHNTRLAGNYHTKYSGKIDISKQLRCFSRLGAKLWNSISQQNTEECVQ